MYSILPVPEQWISHLIVYFSEVCRQTCLPCRHRVTGVKPLRAYYLKDPSFKGFRANISAISSDTHHPKSSYVTTKRYETSACGCNNNTIFQEELDITSEVASQSHKHGRITHVRQDGFIISLVLKCLVTIVFKLG